VERTTLSEIKAWIGLLYMAGVFKSNRQMICGPTIRLAWRLLDPQWVCNALDFYSSVFASMTEQEVWQWISWKNITGERAACSHLSRERRTKLKRRITSPAWEQEVKRLNFKVVVPFAPAQKIGKRSICARNV